MHRQDSHYEDEDPCCVACCPSPENSIVVCTEQLEPYRKLLYLVVWGEVVSSLLRVFLFDPFSGLLSAISIWIDYMGYATLHFC